MYLCFQGTKLNHVYKIVQQNFKLFEFFGTFEMLIAKPFILFLITSKILKFQLADADSIKFIFLV